MKIMQITQKGPDWLRWRQAGIGGSDAPVISGDSPYMSEDTLLLSKKEGNKKVVKESAAMKRGKHLEPRARVKYQELTGIRVRPVCVVHEEHEWLRASLDGLSFDGQTVLEIKCPSDFHHETALSGSIPAHYIPQVQHLLLVTGCPQAHYFSFTDRKKWKPEECFALVKVLPDREYMDWLFKREEAWWKKHGIEVA